jgi:hypothetical protein
LASAKRVGEGIIEKDPQQKTKVRDQNIPTERPPIVGEVSANFCG